MHLLRIESRSLDGIAEAVDLGQTPADIVALSFNDADLAVLAAAWPLAGRPGLRLANLAALRHPFSVDLYIDKVLSRSRFVLVRLLGGADYWRYGVEELAAMARARGIALAIVPGDHRDDPRLEEASTVERSVLRRIGAYFAAGGVDNIAACLRFIGSDMIVDTFATIVDSPEIVPPSGAFAAAAPAGPPLAPLALIVFYRSWMLAADAEPVVALAGALASSGLRAAAWYVTSLKDPAATGPLGDWIAAERPAVILNLTAFSARLETSGSVLDGAAAPVLQLTLSGATRQQWTESRRGLSPADLAMNVVLPEIDGRIIAGAISFKAETARHQALEFTGMAHRPDPDGIAHAAGLARAWAALRGTPRAERRVGCVLPDYPAKSGRTGYAVGLDTPASVIAIARRLASEGYAVTPPADTAALTGEVATGEPKDAIGVAGYERAFARLPAGFTAPVRAAWGEPADDPAVSGGAFRFRYVRAGALLIAVQPDRGTAGARKAEYHDPNLPPTHGYIAFYLWLRHVESVHAVIHCGTHGTLEWLPGKAVALSPDCAPRAVLGCMPLIYPFIVNNPGEAAQAKRRTAAVTIGHLTPPLIEAGVHGAAHELERLFDEYAEAQSLDDRRAARLADLIMARARETGLAAEAGLDEGAGAADALVRLDAWLCDLKDLRIGDGLHVFGTPSVTPRSLDAAGFSACAEAEMRGLLTALDGGFVPPGPAGAPDRGRLDVLPTGRNLYGIDPRAVPTRTAWEIGRRTAEALLTRHSQDHGEWPRRIVLDLWGSATMRTGGDDLAQAMALLGVRPRWDDGSGRVGGFDILPLAVLDRPRVDVTLRISGLFRDVFPAQIALFAAIVREVAALDEAPEDNPLAAGAGSGQRVFGAAPGAYGIGVSRLISSGAWVDRDELGAAYLAATSHAYGIDAEGVPAAPDFRDRVARADAYVHVRDLPGQDLLSGDAFAEHGGGFAAAAASMGRSPALYHADTTSPEMPKIRTTREEVARVARARAANPRWLAGQARHGFRGAAEIAETIDNFFAYAALAKVTESHQFDLIFDATIGDDAMRAFLTDANPAAARAIARRFQEAMTRGLWTPRRNSVGPVLKALGVAAG